jgi:hypothetical protein
MRTPHTTPAMLREAYEHLSRAIEILAEFQAEVEAAGQEDEELDGLLDALQTPLSCEGTVADAANDIVWNYGGTDEDAAQGADLTQTIYSERDFADADAEVAGVETPQA